MIYSIRSTQAVDAPAIALPNGQIHLRRLRIWNIVRSGFVYCKEVTCTGLKGCYQNDLPMAVHDRWGEVANGCFVALQFLKSGFG